MFKNKLMWIIGIVMFLLTMNSVLALTNNTVGTFLTVGGAEGGLYENGYTITPNKDTCIKKVTMGRYTANVDNCFVFNSTGVSALNATSAGGDCDFAGNGVPLTSGAVYYVLGWKSGGYTRGYAESGFSYPIVATDISFNKSTYRTRSTGLFTEATNTVQMFESIITGPCVGSPSGTVNISETIPVNLSSFNSNPVYFYVFANLSYVNTNASLYINGTLNQTKYLVGSGTNINISFNISFTDGKYTYFVHVFDNTTDRNSSTKTFWFDSVNPTITYNYPSPSNNTILIGNNTLVANVTIADTNLYSFHFNISWVNGTRIFGTVNTTLTGITSFNYINLTNLSAYPGELMLTTYVCDGHTANTIDSYENRVLNNKFSFDIYKENVQIYSENTNEDDEITYKKLKDRYSFDFKNKVASNTKTIIVESNEFIDILNTNYKGHLVTGNKWIDFETDNINSVNVERINNKKVRVTVVSYSTKTKWSFNSIGELNCIKREVTFFNSLVETAHTTPVKTGDSSIFYINLTYDADYMQNVSASLYHNGTYYTATGTQSGSKYLFSTSLTKTPTIDSIYFFNWTYWINGENYTTLTFNQTYYSFGLENCTSYYIRTINFSIRNITDNSLVSGILEGYFTTYLTNGSVYKNYNMTWGTSATNNQSVCIFPNATSFLTDAQLEYTVAGTTRTYYFTGNNLTNVTQLINLYTQDGTSLVLFTVTDENDNPVVNAYITILSYDLTTSSYDTVEIIKTDSQGKAVGNVILNTQWYKFIVTYGGVVYLTTEPTKILTTTYSLQITLGSDFLTAYDTVKGVSCSMAYVNSTKTFTYTYSDPASSTSEGCVKLVKKTNDGDTVLNNTCQSGSSGSIIFTLPDVVGKNLYIAQGMVTISGVEYLCTQNEVSFNEDYKVYGNEGLFGSFLLILTLVFVGIWSPVVGILLLIVGVMLSIIVGIFKLGWASLVTLIILAIITLYKLNKKT